MTKRLVALLSFACLLLPAASSPAQPTPLGLFTDHADVGTVLHPGTVLYDEAHRTYTITGSGENVWATADAFQFVWKKMEGDFTLSADISILGQGGDPHKKAMLMARQSLDADSAYADVALHSSGLASLQSPDAKGSDTHEIQSNITAPKHLRLQKYRDEFTMWISGADGKFQMAGGSMRVPLTGPFYVGLGVCAHNKDAVETAEFGNVAIGAVSFESHERPYHTLETVTVASTDRRVTYVVSGGIEAPNWTRDGESLLFTENGRIESVPVAGGEPKVIEMRSPGRVSTMFHGISPDGKMLAISVARLRTARFGPGDIAIYVIPISGGAPRRVTAESPSTWQGWSPDGMIIVFIGKRHGELGIYTIPVAGGAETRLTTTSADGSAEYSPDGEYIYFNSDRSGAMEIWRMRPDGSHPEQVTNDGAGNWAPHISPDGLLLAFLTPQKKDSHFSGGPAPVMLRVMSLADRHIRVLAKFTGERTSMLNPSWSPDSRRLAFVSYQFEPPTPAVVIE
jgi:hypothetical protein